MLASSAVGRNQYQSLSRLVQQKKLEFGFHKIFSIFPTYLSSERDEIDNLAISRATKMIQSAQDNNAAWNDISQR